MATGDSGKVSPGTGLAFKKYCDIESPLPASGTQTISQAFVYSFSDCVEVCASFNFYAGDNNCTVAVYAPDSRRPANCWIGAPDSSTTKLSKKAGTDVAVLDATGS